MVAYQAVMPPMKPILLCAALLPWWSLGGTAAEIAHSDAPVMAVLDPAKASVVVNRNLYGQFAEHLGGCIYGGLWVGEDSSIPNTKGIRNDVVAALRALEIPVLRWPGGCFADEYHWKDGIGPRAQRPSMTNTHWGKVVENNHFGTHEFFELCEQLGCDAYVSGNVGSGSVQEMMQWVEYMTSDADTPMANLRRQHGRQQPWKLKFFGVGNESWGCGGAMRPEYYADLFRHYNTFVKDYPGSNVQRIACGANGDDYRWTEVMMRQVGKRMDGLSLHYYTSPTGSHKHKSRALEFDEQGWFQVMAGTWRMETLIANHVAIMDQHDPDRRVGLVIDEWGIWHAVEKGTNPGFLYQQNTLRDAVSAALHLHMFQRHADRVTMTNIAQMVNVLQAMVLTDGKRMLRTPTYWVFEMLKRHQGAKVIPLELASPDYVHGERKVPALSASATVDAAGGMLVSLVNCDPKQPHQVRFTIPGLSSRKQMRCSGRLLTAEQLQAHNSFEQPDAVVPVSSVVFEIQGDEILVNLPAKSIQTLTFE